MIKFDIEGIMTSVKKKILKNTAANTFMKLWRYGINFFMLPFIILHVGVVDYGLYLLVGAFVGYFGLLDLGVGTSLVKYVAEYNAKGDKEMINKIVNSTFLFYLCIGVAVCIGVITIGYFFVDFFKIESGSVELARAIAAMVAIGALTSWPIRSFSTSLEGLQRYDLTVFIDFITINATAGATIILLLSGYGIVDIIFWGIVVGAIGQILKVWLAQRMMPFLSLKMKYMNMETMKKIFKFSSVVFTFQLVYMIMLGSDRIVLGLFVGVAAITYYYITRSLHDLVQTVSALPSSSILPAASELIAKNDEKTLKSLIYRGSKYQIALSLPISILVIIFAKDILYFWMGIDYIWLTPYVQLFVSYRILITSWGMMDTVIIAKEQYKPVLKIEITNAAINLALSVILTYYFGLVGVIAGTVLGWIFIYPWVLKAYFKYCNISGTEYFHRVIMTTFGPACAMVFTLLSLNFIINSDNLIILGLICLVGLICYLLLFYYKGLDGNERSEIKVIMKKYNFLSKS
jgi:O-antigen/teichoic acid export membrane protein